MKCAPLLLLAALVAVPSLVPAQAVDTVAVERSPSAVVAHGLTTVGSAAEERLRNDQLRGVVAPTGFVLRSPSSLTPYSRGSQVALLLPEARFAWNSAIPYSVNDGAMWAGRGASAVLMAGAGLHAGPVRLVLAPELVWAENQPFDALLPRQWTPEQRAAFIPPWQTAEHSVDIPYRFGADGWLRLRPGQSSLTVRAGRFAAGAATENQWWGPGVQNAILMTNNAPGIPHLFARTDRPIQTPVGAVEGRWMIGILESSAEMLTQTGSEGRRSLSAAALVWHPAAAPNLALGLARAVYAPRVGFADALGGAPDVFTRWGGAGDSVATRPFEQIFSTFGRWVFPDDGAEVYAEWARYRLPGSVGELLESPEHTQGYVVGAQWLRPLRLGEIRLHAEAASLEESPTYRTREIGSYYASAVVPQGYTQQGQVIGAAMGPGSSGQWFATDWLWNSTRLGVLVGRVRWANDAYYDNPATARMVWQGRSVPRSLPHGHDVSVLAGFRASIPVRQMQIDAEWIAGQRYNFLFQSYAQPGWANRDDVVDVFNHTLGVRISPRPPRR